MCRPVRCNSCGKTTWAGCGQHIDQVKAGVAAGQWCTCDQDGGGQPQRKGLFGGLFGR